jgi:mono/diheme cytochrome c family protein
MSKEKILPGKILALSSLGLLCFAAPPVKADSRVAASTIDGRVLYQKLCSDCHGETGRPLADVRTLLSPPPSDLTAAHYKYGDTARDIRRVIRSGTGTNMIHYQHRLSREQIYALTDFVLTLKENEKVLPQHNANDSSARKQNSESEQ